VGSEAYSLYYNPVLPSFYILKPYPFVYSPDTYKHNKSISASDTSLSGLPVLPLFKTANFSISYARYFESLNYGSFFSTFQFRKWGTFGIGIISLFYNDINRTDIDSSGNYILMPGSINVENYCLLLNYSFKINEEIGVGINVKGIVEGLDNTGGLFFSTDLGFLYKNPIWGIGLVFRNIGMPVKLDRSEFDQPLDIELGGHYTLRIKKLLIYPRDKILITGKVKKGIESEFISGGGIEYKLKNMIFLRTGYQFNGNDDGFKIGIGLQYRNMQLDYALSFYGNLGGTHRIGFSMNFENKNYRIKEKGEKDLFKKSKRGLEVGIQTDLLFDYNSHELSYRANEILNKVIAIIKNLPNYLVRIEGNTDDRGNDTYNFKLSRKRAYSIYHYLANHGLEKTRLIAISLGERNPIRSNDTLEGRQMNRRVDIILMEKKEKKSIQEMINELPRSERIKVEELYYFGLDSFYKDDFKGAVELWQKIETGNQELQKRINIKIKQIKEKMK